MPEILVAGKLYILKAAKKGKTHFLAGKAKNPANCIAGETHSRKNVWPENCIAGKLNSQKTV
jgi:hypothetical protein